MRVEVSFGRGGLTHLCIIFFRSEMTSGSVSQKVDTEIGPPPTSEAIPRDTDNLRPSKVVARTVRPVEHTPSKFGHDPCRVNRGLVVAAKCCVRKARFFFFAVWAAFGTEQGKPEPCVGLNSTPQKAKTCFVFCFPIQ